ncbi:hypothetical protein OQA88_5668 [Cercophora sp. LCS_1]
MASTPQFRAAQVTQCYLPLDLAFDYEDEEVIAKLKPELLADKIYGQAVPVELPYLHVPDRYQHTGNGYYMDQLGAVTFELPMYASRPDTPRPRDGISRRHWQDKLPDATAPALDRYIKTSDGQVSDRDLEFLWDTYLYSLIEDIDCPHPTDLNARGGPLPLGFDDATTPAEPALRNVRFCHNGLYDFRHGNNTSPVHIYMLLQRLLYWDAMCNPRYTFSSKRFYVVKPYRVLLRPDRPNKTPQNRFDARMDDDFKNQDHRAYITSRPWLVMFVQFDEPDTPTEQWSVCIQHNKTKAVWYFDCGDKNTRQARFEGALREFDAWLVKVGSVGRAGPAAMYPDLPEIAKDRMHLSPLHCMANALAFLIYGVIGWNEVGQFEHRNAKKMEEAMLTSLHSILGLEYRTPSLAQGTANLFKRH